MLVAREVGRRKVGCRIAGRSRFPLPLGWTKIPDALFLVDGDRFFDEACKFGEVEPARCRLVAQDRRLLRRRKGNAGFSSADPLRFELPGGGRRELVEREPEVVAAHLRAPRGWLPVDDEGYRRVTFRAGHWYKIGNPAAA